MIVIIVIEMLIKRFFFFDWLQDGITWLINPPHESLAFILADNGYDVWIANTRGTKFSQGHTSLSPQDPVKIN